MYNYCHLSYKQTKLILHFYYYLSIISLFRTQLLHLRHTTQVKHSRQQFFYPPPKKMQCYYRKLIMWLDFKYHVWKCRRFFFINPCKKVLEDLCQQEKIYEFFKDGLEIAYFHISICLPLHNAIISVKESARISMCKEQERQTHSLILTQLHVPFNSVWCICRKNSSK